MIDAAVAGFASVGPDRHADAGPETGELRALYVHPDHWNRGVGRDPHDHAVASLRDGGYRDAILWVLATNARAQRFYERAGWQRDGTERVDTTRDGLKLEEIRYATTL